MSKLALNILSFYDRESTVVEIISSDQKVLLPSQKKL